ncbi:MAG: acyl-ACP--UDP-N-acetylglucosamine O-acyltransferase [Planctomycetes bacterium]|nr:acyl-ACP--UDP-N-acetylglucosamine O-acyltransferase [Planctomycetota bacterium]
MGIHPLAVVDSRAQIGANVDIGPFAIVEADAVIGDDCTIDAYAMIKSGVKMGPRNHVFERAVIGGAPQHLRVPDEIGDVVIGEGNTFRENVTIHRALHAGATTQLGDNNFLMVGVHVAHDCVVGSNVIFANGSMLAGHVTVEDRAYISGGVAVHQFCRVGKLVMVGGTALVTKDVPPYVTIDGCTGYVVGLNSVGLRRAGYTAAQIAELKAAYRVIYRSSLRWQEIIERLKAEFTNEPAADYGRFLPLVTRGIINERRLPPGVGVKIGEEATVVQNDSQRKVG